MTRGCDVGSYVPLLSTSVRVCVCVWKHLEQASQTRVAKINRACQIRMYNQPDSTCASTADAVNNGQTRLGEDNQTTNMKENTRRPTDWRQMMQAK